MGDNGHVPSLEEFFSDVDSNIARAKAERRPRQEHPHTKLKREARAALSLWKKRTGISAYYLPYFVGRVHLGEGRTKRPAYVGKKGASDSFIGLLGTVVAAEAKTGGATLKPDQIEFRRRWQKAGLPFVEYHTPQQLIDYLEQIAVGCGWRPF